MAIQTVGVIGAGTMGNGIAHVFARTGHHVILCDVEQRFLDRALGIIAKNLDREVAKNKLKQVLTFYNGKAGATVVGALTFARVDTPHGPVEVAVGFTPQGAVRGVIVTKATVETKPWVLEAVGAGLVERYRGLKPGDVPAGAAVLAEHAGKLAVYIAGEVDKGVARALAAYGVFHNHVRA